MAASRSPVGYISGLQDLHRGDVIIFGVGLTNPEASSQVIAVAQNVLARQTDGHIDSTHCAIYVSDEKIRPTLPRIAHVGGEGFKVESLPDYSSDDRPFIVFRPNNPNVAKRIHEMAIHDANKKITGYSVTGVLKTPLIKSALNPTRGIDSPEFRQEQFCSEFVINILNKVDNLMTIRRAEVKHISDIDRISSPRALEHHLYRDKKDDFQMLVYPGVSNPYKKIKALISACLEKIDQGNEVGRLKYRACKNYFHYAKAVLDVDSGKNNFEKAQCLLSGLLPKLEIATGFSASKTHAQVLAMAEKMRIFKRDIPSEYRKELDTKITAAMADRARLFSQVDAASGVEIKAIPIPKEEKEVDAAPPAKEETEVDAAPPRLDR